MKRMIQIFAALLEALYKAILLLCIMLITYLMRLFSGIRYPHCSPSVNSSQTLFLCRMESMIL